jgi:hypothetical protein
MRVKIFAGADIEHEESGDFCTLDSSKCAGRRIAKDRVTIRAVLRFADRSSRKVFRL